MAKWTPAHCCELERRWLRGDASSQIAEAFGPRFTRNAIMGKLNRMGLLTAREPDQAGLSPRQVQQIRAWMQPGYREAMRAAIKIGRRTSVIRALRRRAERAAKNNRARELHRKSV